MGFHEPGEISAASSYGAKRAGGNKRGFELWSQKTGEISAAFALGRFLAPGGTGEISAAFASRRFLAPWGTGEISATFVEAAGRISAAFREK